MASVHRKLLSSTLTINITIPPCPPQLCFKLCSCELPPPPPPHEHHLVPNRMTIMACVMGIFFILGMICIVAGLKHLKRIVSRRRNPPLVLVTRDDFVDQHPIWLINLVGLEQSVIDSITVFKYKRGEGLIEGTECSVCLGEFDEDEDLRLLPKCSHAFHLPCIDTWLRSHKNCPLCRAPIVSSTAAVASEPAMIDSSQLENGLDHQQVGEDVARSEIDATGSSTSSNTSTGTSLCRLMKSASLGRKGPVLMKRSFSSRNCRSLDLIRPM